MRSYSFHPSIVIDRPADLVWSIVADYGADPRWRRGVATMTPEPPGPVTVATTTREVLRLGGRTYLTHGEVVDVCDVDGGRRFAWRAASDDGRSAARGSRTVVALDAHSCRVELELHVDVHGAQQVTGPLLARVLRRTLTGDLARLRELALACQPTSTSIETGTPLVMTS